VQVVGDLLQLFAALFEFAQFEVLVVHLAVEVCDGLPREGKVVASNHVLSLYLLADYNHPEVALLDVHDLELLKQGFELE